MPGLAAHHVVRDELAAVLDGGPIAVVLAGGGYGKTSLTMELEAHDPLAVRVALPEGATPADLLTATARAARLRGRDALRERLVGPSATPGAELDLLVDVFADLTDGLHLLLDDIEHVHPSTGALLDRLARTLTSPHQLVLVGRALPPGCRLERLPNLRQLDSTDLALTARQAGKLLRDGLGLDLADDQVRDVHAATGGWAAGLVMWGQQRGADGPAYPHGDRGLDGHDDPSRVLDRLVERMRGPLSEHDRWCAAQLAHLPTFDEDLADAIGGPGTLRRLTASGLAITTVGQDRRRMVGPLAERARSWAPLDHGTARRAAARYHDDGDLPEAVRLLVAAGCGDDAARRILDDPTLEDDLTPGEIVAVIDLLPGATRARHPWVEIVLATALVEARRWEEWALLLDRLDALAGSRDDPRFVAAVQAERALEQIYLHGRRDAAQELIGRVATRGDDLALSTRLRVQEVLTRVLRFGHDVASFQRARAAAETGVSLARTEGSQRACARALLMLTKMVLFPLGRSSEMLLVYDELLTITRPHSHQRGYVQLFRAEALIDVGEDAEARAALDEAETIAVQMRDELMHGASAWARSIIASQREDAAETVRWHLEAARRFPSSLDRNNAVLFHRDRIEQGLRIGRPDVCERALRQLDRVVPGDAETGTYASQARAFHAALLGDPAAAIEALDVLQRDHPTPRDEWRRHLHRAAAYERLGDARAGPEAATGFELALQLAGPETARIREPRLSRLLAPVAAAAGANGAVPRGEAASVHIRALGAFVVEVDGTDVTPHPGRSSDLLQLLTAFRHLHVERAIDAMWPDADAARGRRALRNALHRLPSRDRLVVRRGDRLELADGVAVDALDVCDEALAVRERLRVDPQTALPTAIRVALRYRGELLPGCTLSPVADARSALARIASALCDDAARAAMSLGRPDDAIDLLRGGVAAEPADEGRRVRLAALLLDLGRSVDARSVVDEIEQLAADLGLQPGPAVTALRHRLGEVTTSDPTGHAARP